MEMLPCLVGPARTDRRAGDAVASAGSAWPDGFEPAGPSRFRFIGTGNGSTSAACPGSQIRSEIRAASLAIDVYPPLRIGGEKSNLVSVSRKPVCNKGPAL